MIRKTIKREIILRNLNNVLRSKEISNEEKLAVATYVEGILIASNSYDGYTIPYPGAGISERVYS